MEAFQLILLLMAPSFTLQYISFRSDARCGRDFLAPNGEPAQCDPNSDYHCCSTDGWCGSSKGHCSCVGCVDYRELETGVRFDGRCGYRYPLTNGQPSKCDPDSEGSCCSPHGWCGNGPDYCSCDGCIDYRDLERGVRSDGRCGDQYPLTNGQPGKCDPKSGGPCCSTDGWCGDTSGHCTCWGCIDYRDLELGVRSDGRCGNHYPLTNGEPGKCDPDSGGPCCSYDGWCGSGSDHCTCEICIDYRDLERGARGDGRCGYEYPLKNGQPGECVPDSESPCCSPYGWCGNGQDFCECYGCVDFRDSEGWVRADGRCGYYYPLKNGQPGKCDPGSESPCCSPYGWCGNGDDYCACYYCDDFRA